MKYEQGATIATRRPSPARPGGRHYSFAALVIYAAVLALLTGFGSTWWMLSDSYPFGRKKAGAWLYWPDIGSRNTDPYALAMVSRDAVLPLGVSEGIELLATRDTEGNPLRATCAYRLGPTMPHARFWTLGAYNISGSVFGADVNRFAFTSSELVRNEDGSFTIALSRDIAPGNWLPLSGKGRMALVLRLYDVPANGGRTAIDPELAPNIERMECQS